MKPTHAYKCLTVSYIVCKVCLLHVSATLVAILRDMCYKGYNKKILEPMQKCRCICESVKKCVCSVFFIMHSPEATCRRYTMYLIYYKLLLNMYMHLLNSSSYWTNLIHSHRSFKIITLVQHNLWMLQSSSLLLLLGAELPLVVESFVLLNDLFPVPSILDAGYSVFNLHLPNILFDVILPSVLGSSLWSFG